MAKKKKAKKKVKRKTQVATVRCWVGDKSARVLLAEKMQKVKEMIPEIPTTGESDPDPQTGETYPYTEAEKVREMYFEAFDEVGLQVRPIASSNMMPQLMIGGGFCGIIGCFEIVDTETGYSIHGWGAGLGRNGFWAANTAQTLAMKQFLISSFGANWKDPKKEKFHTVIGKEISDMTPKEAAEAMERFFGGQGTIQDLKGDQYGTTNTKHRTGDRGGQKPKPKPRPKSTKPRSKRPR